MQFEKIGTGALLALGVGTVLDFIAAMYALGIVSLSVWALEAVFAAFGAAVFCGAYLLLYRRDAAQAE